MKHICFLAFAFIATQVLVACQPGPCPDGYLRDNDGNCVWIGDDDETGDDDDADDDDAADDDVADDDVADDDVADDDDTEPQPDMCSLIITVSSGCSYCADEGIHFERIENEDWDDSLSVGDNNNLMPGESDGGSIAAGVITLEWNLIGFAYSWPDECWENPEDYGMYWDGGRPVGNDTFACVADSAVEYTIVCDPGS